MLLTLARHGETQENIDNIIQGQLPGSLTDNGVRQAVELGELLKDEHFDAIISSDLSRCTDTAEYVRLHHPGVYFAFSEELRERGFGDYEGRKGKDVDWGLYGESFYTAKPGGGESVQDLANRVRRYINKLLSARKDQKVLLITHGGPMMVVKSAIESVSLEEVYRSRVEACAVWHYEIESPLKLID